ncbi:MAG TPA: response regulator [Patescibacteria group bacterium]|nr:response regulator [Patescibacteria group bacterium]
MKKQTVLLIDDNRDILEAVQLLLEDAGYIVQVIDNGDYATHIDKNHLPDVIFLDMLLSGCDGRTIIHQFKTREDTKHIPIILNSAHPQAKNFWTSSGADDFIAKPFDIDALLALIQKHVRKTLP